MRRPRQPHVRSLLLAGFAAALVWSWVWARRKARAYEDRDPLREPAPGQRMEIDGALLHYIERGQGPPIMLIHGLGASTYTWRYAIDDLAREFRVVALDLLGFGHSQRVADADYSLSGHARRVAVLMDRLGIGRATIVGHSLGGLVALHLAGGFPEKVSALILVAPARPQEARALSRTRYLRLLYPFFYALVYQSRGMRRRELSLLYADPSAVSDEVVRHYLELARFQGHQEALARLARDIARDPPLDLARLDVPVLLIWGESDRLMPPSRSRWLLERLPDVRLVRLTGAGHMAPEERPDDFNSLVAEFAAHEPTLAAP
jgi:pimeloyl-ACP methyl ester carboxylesterase